MSSNGSGYPGTPAEALVLLRNSQPFLPVFLIEDGGNVLYQHPVDAVWSSDGWRMVPLEGGQLWFCSQPDAEEVQLIGPFEKLVADTQDPVLVVGANGQILLGNRSAKEIFGEIHSLDALPAGALWALIHDKPSMQLHVGMDGQERMLLWRGHTLPQAVPVRALQAVKIDFDLREERLQQLQQQLAVAAQLSSFGALATVVVHELNQPLHVLSNYVELLRAGHFSGDMQEKAYQVMGRAITRMQTLVQSLREQASLPRRERIDLKVVVDLARELTVGGAMVRLEVESVWVEGESGRLEQVVINLLANALQAGSPETVVRVFAAGQEAVLEVADRGHGIPENLKTKIFEPFFTTKPQKAGVGLGLTVSLGIVQAHAGRVEVMDNPGGGSIFRVVLPQAAES